MFKKLLMTLIVTFMVTNGYSLTYITHDTTWSGNMTLNDSYFINPGIILRIAPNSEITFPSGTYLSSPAGILEIGDGVVLIGEDNSNYIKLSGRLYMGENILLSAVNSNSEWMGLVLSSCDVPTNIHRAYFRRSNLQIYDTDLNIFDSDFSVSLIEIFESSVGFYNCNFINSNISIIDQNGLPYDTNLTLYDSMFDGISPYSNNQLYMERVYKYDIRRNEFKNGVNAIYGRYSGNGNLRSIDSNEIHHNSSNGIYLHYTHSSIIRANHIYRNGIGILSSGTANIELAGNDAGQDYQKITDNQSYQVAFSHGSFPDPFKYNIIANSNNINLVTCIGHSNNYPPHDITHNYWGGNILNPQSAFDPLNGFLWQSAWAPSKSEVVEQIADNFTLSQNYPNPFNPTTTISFTTVENSNVNMVVFNSLGEEVLNFGEKVYSSGTHNIEFDGSNLNSGIYFYRLTVNGVSKTKKMILAK